MNYYEMSPEDEQRQRDLERDIEYGEVFGSSSSPQDDNVHRTNSIKIDDREFVFFEEDRGYRISENGEWVNIQNVQATPSEDGYIKDFPNFLKCNVSGQIVSRHSAVQCAKCNRVLYVHHARKHEGLWYCKKAYRIKKALMVLGLFSKVIKVLVLGLCGQKLVKKEDSPYESQPQGVWDEPISPPTYSSPRYRSPFEKDASGNYRAWD